MQTGKFRKPSFIVLPFILVVLLSSVLPVFAQAPKKVAILPFDVLAAKDFAYLQEGVRVMLASRLAAGAGVTVVDRAAVDQALAGNGKALTPEKIVGLGKKLGADYLVTGNLTAMGGVSLDAKVHTVADGGVQNFFATAAKEGEVINAVDQLAWDVAAKVFGVTPPAGRGSVATSVPAAQAAAQSPYQTVHPDRGFRSQYGGGSSPFLYAGGMAGPGGFTKSRNFNMDLQAMEMADVDGDGQAEVILAARQEVKILRREAGRLTDIGFVKSGPRFKIHGVTTADLNENGRAEIYVSAADHQQPNSFAVEWNGKELAPIVQDARWYLRVVSLPGEGMVLLGQRAGTDNPLRPGIYRLALKEGNLVEGESYAVPTGVNLFDFSVGDIDSDGSSEIVSIDQHDRLRVWNTGGSLQWKSDEHYGGTTRFIGGSPDLGGKTTIENPEDDKRIYIPSRIIIADVNNDSFNEVVINKNLSSASRLFEKMKNYPSGEIHALSWNGIGLTELWRTRKIDGYISDYLFQSASDQLNAELVVGVVLGGMTMDLLAELRSTLLTYQVPMKPVENK